MKLLARILTSLALGAALVAQVSPTMNFTTGQAARLVIGQPNFTAQDNNSNQLILGGVGGIAFANDILVVTDANRLQAAPVNHRVMLYRGLTSKFPSPTAELFQTTRCPVCIGAADVVLGQPDFTKLELQAPSNRTMRSPNGVATDGTVLVVADTDFNRVLIWNSIPQSNNTPADVVLGQSDFSKVAPNEGQQNIPTSKAFRGPQSVWVQGGREPVAMMTSLPSISSMPADDFTEIRVGVRNVASPLTCVILWCLKSIATPPVSRSTIFCFHATIFCMSTEMAPSAMPMSPASCARSTTVDAWIIAFEGMQPTLRHTPPSFSFSTQMTFRPFCAARIAATYPPGPAPMTTTSADFMRDLLASAA